MSLFHKKVLLDLARTAISAAIVFLPQLVASNSWSEARLVASLAGTAALSAVLRGLQAQFTNLETPPPPIPVEPGPSSTA